MPENTPVRIAIVDHSEFFRRGIGNCLSCAGYEVVEQARNLTEALEQLDALHPNMLILGPTLTEHEGLAICREIGARSRTIKAIVFTAHSDNPLFLADAVHAGASDCLPVEATEAECLATIEAVINGHQLFSHDILAQALQPIDLTPREREILRLLAQGKTLDQIAKLLVIQLLTVRTHHAHILEKLGVHNRQEAIRRARRRGLV